MFWKSFRPYYWILNRRLRQTNRFIVIMIVFALGFGGQWLYSNVIREKISQIGAENISTVVAGVLPTWLVFLLLMGSLALGDVIYRIYLAPDVEILLIAPIPRHIIYLFRLLQTAGLLAVPTLPILALLIVSGAVTQAGWLFYPLVTLLILALLTLASAVTMASAVVIIRIFSPQRVRMWISAAVGFLGMIYMLAQKPVMFWLEAHPAYYGTIDRALSDLPLLATVTMLLIIAALLVSSAGYIVFLAAFYRGWNTLHEVAERHVPASKTPRAVGLKRHSGVIPAVLRHTMVKEWLELRRESRNMIGLIQPLILLLVFAAISSGKAGSSGLLGSLFYWIVLLFGVIFVSSLPVGTTMMSVLAEGVNIDLIRAAPVAMKRVLLGKFLAWLLPAALVWSAGLTAAGALMKLAAWQTITLIGVIVLDLTGASAVSLAIGALFADFRNEDVKRRIGCLPSYTAMLVNGLFSTLVCLSGMWLIVQIYPGSVPVAAVEAASSFIAPLRWIITGFAGPLVVLVLCHAAFWAGTAVLLHTAVLRLETIEL